jgi:hypothetical protein
LNKRILMIVAGIAVLAALVLGGVAIAGSSGVLDDDGEAQLTGPTADRATAAALKITGGGKANAVERDSENGGTYEVEVTRPDGKTVDVRLDASFNRVAVEGDSEENDGAEQEGEHTN